MTTFFSGEQLYPPFITGAREMYEPDDVIEIGCHSSRTDKNGPRASIKWYFNGQMVRFYKVYIFYSSRGILTDGESNAEPLYIQTKNT